jgi:transcriptional regulator with XRE-family HTH domain
MDTEQEFKNELKLLGKRLKSLRNHRGLTLLDLEMLCGINDSDISRYENGKEKIELYSLYRLAKALKVTLNSLTDYNGELPNDKFTLSTPIKKQKQVLKERKKIKSETKKGTINKNKK